MRRLSILLRDHFSLTLQAGILLTLIFLVSCRPSPSIKSNQPHIILIVLDTVRADRIGFYDNSKNLTPNIDSFLKESLVFKNAYVPERSTPVNHISMFTGLYPVTHHVDAERRGLNPKVHTLAQILKEAGYKTLGFTGFVDLLAPRFGFGRGFDRYVNGKYGVPFHKVNAEVEIKEVFAELDRTKKAGQPIFLFVNLYDAHSEFSGKLPYSATDGREKQMCPEVPKEFDDTIGQHSSSIGLRVANKKRIQLSKEVRDYLACLYDSQFPYLDRWVGNLLSGLKEREMFDDALVILTSDHGEEFQEYGLLLHQNPFLHDLMVRVPLGIKMPQSKEHRVVSTEVNLIELMPTLLEYLDIETPQNIQSESFLNAVLNTQEHPRSVYGMGFWGSAFMREGKWKVNIQKVDSKKPIVELFDLSVDPGERDDVSKKYPEIYEKLRARLLSSYKKAKKGRLATSSHDRSPANTKNLKALGYL